MSDVNGVDGFNESQNELNNSNDANNADALMHLLNPLSVRLNACRPRTGANLHVNVNGSNNAGDRSTNDNRIENENVAEAIGGNRSNANNADNVDTINIANVDTVETSGGREQQSVDNNGPEPRRKRRLVDAESSSSNSSDNECDDSLCTICFESWEMSGTHRLCALKCGHLFGESCIRRWLNINYRNTRLKVCPQCKAKASIRDIRHIYAKRVIAKDRSEERKLAIELSNERMKVCELEIAIYGMHNTNKETLLKVKKLETENERLKELLTEHHIDYIDLEDDSLENLPMRKLCLKSTVEIGRNAGSRVMAFSKNSNQIIASQRSSQSLFPGWGVRFIDFDTLKSENFLFICNKMLRDMSLSHREDLLVLASMETRSKMYDLRTKQVVTQFSIQERPIWSCAMGIQNDSNCVYFGTQGGITHAFDIRNPLLCTHSFGTTEDISPVIGVITLPVTEQVAIPGILVCRLTSLWFHETGTNDGISNRLHVEGPFININYNSQQQTLLITTRSCVVYPDIRYIIGSLELVDRHVVFITKHVFYGSKQALMLVRSTQIPVNRNTLIAAYQQDSRMLNLYDVRRTRLIQSTPIRDVIFDTCPIQTRNNIHLAALSDNRCRIFTVN